MSDTSQRAEPDIVAIADAIAVQAHRGQTDKIGHDYIDQPRSVARRIDPQNAIVVAAALLHDVVEDSELTVEDLEERGIPPKMVAAVHVLTAGTMSGQWLLCRNRRNPVTLAVKLADNTDPAKLGMLDEAMQIKLIAKSEGLIER